MPEVAILIVSRNIGGLERRWAALYRYLSRQRLPYRLTFIVSRMQTAALVNKYVQPSHDALCREEFGVSGNILQRPAFLRPVWRLLDYICLIKLLMTGFRKKRFAAAHFVTPSSLMFSPLVKSGLKVMSVANSGNVEALAKSPVFRRALRAGFHVDHLSADLCRRVSALQLASGKRLHTSPCSFADYGETDVRDKKPWMVFVSRLIQGKGIEILLASLPEILGRCPHLKVKIVGEGALYEQIGRSVGRMSGSDRVWLGFRKEPIDILRHSRIFLSLQDRENYPSQSLLEAMACGNAVIATDVGLTRKIVDENVGVLIDRDSNQLTAAVCQLAADDALADRLGKMARERVSKEHSPARYFTYLDDIYRHGDELPAEA